MAPNIFAKNTADPKTYVFEVAIEQDEDGRWAAECPALPGCATWGYSKIEALQNIREAVEAYIEDMREAGETIRGAKEIIHAPAVSVVTV